MTARKAPATELRPTGRRVEDFSDAVFAIVITITVLEVRIPGSLAFADDPVALQAFMAELITYALSFIVIANLWTSHHYLLFTLTMPTRATLWLNNHLLFWVTLLPIATHFLGAFPYSPRACAVYGFAGVGVTSAFSVLRAHGARIAHSDLHRQIHRRVLKRTWVFIAIYAASIPLAFVNIWLAWACFVAVPPMFIVPIIRADLTADRDAHQDLGRSCP